MNFSLRLETELEAILSKKPMNRRCILHQTDFQKQIKQNKIQDWVNIWDSIESDELKRQLTIIDSNQLLATINDYLKRNKLDF